MRKKYMDIWEKLGKGSSEYSQAMKDLPALTQRAHDLDTDELAAITEAIRKKDRDLIEIITGVWDTGVISGMKLQEKLSADQRLLSVEDSGKYLGVSRRTVYTMIESGDLPIVKIGRSTRIDKEDLNRLISDKKQKTK